MHNNFQILTSDAQTLENDRFDDDCEFTIEELTARETIGLLREDVKSKYFRGTVSESCSPSPSR